MDIEEVRTYCLSKPESEESFPFDDDTLVFKVRGRIFACLSLERPDWLVLKCDPDYAIELRDRFSAIEPAFHFNKKHWNQHHLSQLEEGLVHSLIDHSYDCVVRKMPRKDQRELLASNN